MRHPSKRAKSIILIVFCIFFSCKKDHITIEEPNPISYFLTEGRIHSKCPLYSISYWSYYSTEILTIDYSSSNIIDTIEVKRGDNGAYHRYKFNYDRKRISNVILKESDCGQCYINTKIFKYTYDENGLLLSIVAEDEFFIQEAIFYYENEEVYKIRTGFNSISQNYKEFTDWFFFYDIMGNVKEVLTKYSSSTEYAEKFTYGYDSTINPFKGNYILRTELWTFLGYEISIGPGFLSTNNVVYCRKESLNSENSVQIDFYNDFTSGLLEFFGHDNEYSIFIYDCF